MCAGSVLVCVCVCVCERVCACAESHVFAGRRRDRHRTLSISAVHELLVLNEHRMAAAHRRAARDLSGERRVSRPTDRTNRCGVAGGGGPNRVLSSGRWSVCGGTPVLWLVVAPQLPPLSHRMPASGMRHQCPRHWSCTLVCRPHCRAADQPAARAGLSDAGSWGGRHSGAGTGC